MPLVQVYVAAEIVEGRRPDWLRVDILPPIRDWIRKRWCSDGVDLDLEEVEVHVHRMSENDLPGPAGFKVLIESNAMPERVARKKETTRELAGVVRTLLKKHGVETRVAVAVSFTDSWSHLD